MDPSPDPRFGREYVTLHGYEIANPCRRRHHRCTASFCVVVGGRTGSGEAKKVRKRVLDIKRGRGNVAVEPKNEKSDIWFPRAHEAGKTLLFVLEGF